MKNGIKRHSEPPIMFPLTVTRIGGICDFYGGKVHVHKRRKVEYIDIPAAFDIETSSFYQDGEKRACMWVWSFCIAGKVLYGRTWEEFTALCDQLVKYFRTGPSRHLVIYVHNLAYDWQFFRRWLDWDQVFAISTRRIAYGVTTTGLEFRCSYILTGCSLAELGKKLHHYNAGKMVGDLDYSLIRHATTPITEKELGYIVYDVYTLVCYIQEQIEGGEDLAHIPLTKTGYVRRMTKQATLHTGRKSRDYRYRKLIRSLTLTTDEYKLLKQAFQGGFTHASAWRSGKVWENVGSIDFTSSYPYVMVARYFPMSAGKIVHPADRKEFMHYIRNYCCLFVLHLKNVEPRVFYEHIISSSKCRNLSGAVCDNGRVVYADTLSITVTELDFLAYWQFYKWDAMQVDQFYIYERGYLPTAFVASILSLYSDKTTLKGVDGREADYLRSKESVNSEYGMTVTDIVRDEQFYDLELSQWGDPITPDAGEVIEKYNKNHERFLFYPWGVWVTAHARYNLFKGILEFGGDYIYSDTDSIKAVNMEKHKEWITKYNDEVKRSLSVAMRAHGLPDAMWKPKTIRGEEKPLGVWDNEGDDHYIAYTRFKTLGAKRYMVEHEGKINITVSGVNKRVAMPYILSLPEDPFEAFAENLIIPKGYTGKQVHTYFDEDAGGTIVDYLGHPGEYHEKSYIHLEAAEYHLSLSGEYKDFLQGIQYMEGTF